MKAVFKSIARGMAVVLVLCIVFTTIILNSRQQVSANEAFDGIGELIRVNSEDNPYRVVELVPDESMAELGYMVRGKEPIQWLGKLAHITGAASRKQYVDSVKSKLSSIVSEDVSRPITYKDYEESYAVDNPQEWSLLYLAKPETIEAGKNGYRMEDVGPGNGDYEEQFAYEVNLDGKGQYNQNVDYYIYGSGYYGVEFSAVETQIDDEGLVVPSEERLYKVRSSTAIVKESKFQELAANTPNAYLYRLSRSDIMGAYECVLEENGRPVTLSNTSFSDFDIAKYIYFTVEFEYVPNEELNRNEIYYEAASVEFYNDQTSGEYGAHLQEEAYVESADDNGNPNGHFDRSADAAYIYVGDEMGSFILVRDENGELIYPVIVDKIYYKGGFLNNNWLINGVFNQDNYFDENQDKTMYFDIASMIPEVFNNTELLSYNLLYIGGSSRINGQPDSFSKANDISWEKAVSVANTIQSQLFPVIVDYSVLGNAVNDLSNASNLQKLIAMLTSDNFYDLDITVENEKNANFWKSLVISKDNDNHFVNKSIYVIPNANGFFFDSFLTSFFGKINDEKTFETKAKEAGFGEIATYINSQNLSRKTENDALGEDKYGYFDLDISKAIAIEYIISCLNMEEEAFNDTLNVLDIEPCYVDDNTSDAINGDTIKRWFTDKGYAIKAVNVKHMSTAEFIGSIQDLSDYDMIYMGLSKNRLPIDATTKETRYNDINMNGLIYSNVGDVCVVTKDHAGLLESDYYYNGIGERVDVKDFTDDNRVDHTWAYADTNNTYRYSGNDITREKVEVLLDYAKTGSPVILADDFFVKNGNNYNVNDYLIDNCSYMYELMGNILSYDNVMLRSQAIANTTLMYNYVELGRPVINLVEQPKVSGTEYVNLSSNKMNFQFSISNKGTADSSSKFNVTLYLDVNADGKFSRSQEAVEANAVKVYENGTFVQPVAQTNEEGETNYHYELSAGMNHHYELVYALPESYIGIIPWKLKVNQVENEYRYDYETGYVYRENTGIVKTIKILQINHSNNSRSTFNMESELKNPDSMFSNLMEELDDFALDITTINSGVFGDDYYEGYLDQYDMLVIGFADCYDIQDKNGCVNGLKNYINEGKPVLFTHDTTSLYNNSKDPGAWGYYFNSEIRNLVGLDRYGILSSNALKKGVKLVKDSWDTGALYNEAVEFANENGTDLAYNPRSNKREIVRQGQGMAYGDLVRFASAVSRDYNWWYYLNNTVGFKKDGGSDFQMRTTRVSQVNSGQITTYPFIIPEDFEVSQTHAQYYQIDMNEDADDDGESDIVVWYTLEGGGSYKNKVYAASPKDVRNNYYIYTKGNVTYSGVGHSSITGSADELKLYINTMIAAYSSGVHAPEIVLKQTDEENSSGVGTIYVSFDDTITDGKVDMANSSVEQALADKNNEEACADIYFNIEDSNIVKNLKRKEIRIDFGVPVSITEDEYNNNPDKYILVSDQDGSAVYLEKIDIDVYKKGGEKQITYLSSGVTYRASVPLSLLKKGDNYVEIYAVAHTKIIRLNTDGVTEGKPIYTPVAYDTFRIQRIGLANLD